MSDEPSKTLTYADAGVNIDAANALVDQIGPMAARTRIPGVVSGLGGFGGLFDLAASGVWNAGEAPPLLVSSTDGVGTKLKLAFTTGIHDTIGIDCVAMCVNDLLTTGAKPLFFLDYFATGRLNPGVAASVIGGVARGCELAGCALLGGETAEMPGMYGEGEYDLAGFAVGAVARDRLLPNLETIAPGHVLVGVASTGFHSNGFSLIRRIIADHNLDLNATVDGMERPLHQLLLEPTAVYADVIGAWLGWSGDDNAPSLPIAAMAHITGGGLVENLPRVLPKHLGARIDASTWSIPPLFTFMLTTGAVPNEESWRVFNMGIGLVAVLPATEAPSAIARAEAVGRQAWVIGDVVQKAGVVVV
ncbi:MAG: phosphoribosylformylglycinamidine cyclo-ligase [Myxococcota bacterium]